MGFAVTIQSKTRFQVYRDTVITKTDQVHHDMVITKTDMVITGAAPAHRLQFAGADMATAQLRNDSQISAIHHIVLFQENG